MLLVLSLGRLWTDMMLVYPLPQLQQQYRRSLCLPPVSEPWLLCYCRASLSLWQFLWGNHELEVFAPSSLCIESNALERLPWLIYITVFSPPHVGSLPSCIKKNTLVGWNTCLYFINWITMTRKSGKHCV